MTRPATDRRPGRLLPRAAVLSSLPLVTVPLLGMAAAAAPYPPPDQPTTSTSASEVAAGDPVTICAEHYGSDVDVALTDDGKKVTTLHTDSTGKGCATVVWKSPNATAKPVHGSAGAHHVTVRGVDGAGAAAQLVAYRSPSGTVCHTVTNTGPDSSGSTATTHTEVCVEPAHQTSGSSSAGGSVSSSSNGGSRSNFFDLLPRTGIEIAGLVLAAVAAIAVGVASITAARRRRAQ